MMILTQILLPTFTILARNYGMPFVSKIILPSVNLYIKYIKHFAL